MNGFVRHEVPPAIQCVVSHAPRAGWPWASLLVARSLAALMRRIRRIDAERRPHVSRPAWPSPGPLRGWGPADQRTRWPGALPEGFITRRRIRARRVEQLSFRRGERSL